MHGAAEHSFNLYKVSILFAHRAPGIVYSGLCPKTRTAHSLASCAQEAS